MWQYLNPPGAQSTPGDFIVYVRLENPDKFFQVLAFHIGGELFADDTVAFRIGLEKICLTALQPFTDGNEIPGGMQFLYYRGAEFVRKSTERDKIYGCPDSAYVKRGQADGFSVILRRGILCPWQYNPPASAAQ